MSALRIIYGESRPELTIAPEIQKLTHDLMHAPAPASNRTRTSTPARAYTPALEALMAPGLTFKARRETADELFYPAFLSLLERDLIRYDSHLLRDLYDKVNPLGDSAASDSHLLNPSGAEATREDIEHFYTTTKDNLMEVTSAAMKDLGESTEQQDDGAPGLMLPRSGESPDELCVDSGESPSYLATVNQWRPTIRGVADALLKLALPQELIAVPRYRAHASVEGVRLHPSALPLAFIQLETENPQTIWQPVKQLIRHQELQFGGLDIYLLLDVSGSMGGANARFATATSLCLIEGLQVARLRAQREQTQGEVDVRVQILAFGAGLTPLTPLVREPTLAQKELAFFNLMHPRSNFTKVNGALKHVRASTLANPSRKVLCLIVSDGLFSDNLAAFKTMQNMPRRVYAGHINIGDAYGIPLTPHFETISNPKLLPQKLQSLLEEYRQKQPDG
jgi:hypothetical protein